MGCSPFLLLVGASGIEPRLRPAALDAHAHPPAADRYGRSASFAWATCAPLPIAGPIPSPDVKTGSNHGLLPVLVTGWREWNRTTDPYRVKAGQVGKSH